MRGRFYSGSSASGVSGLTSITSRSTRRTTSWTSLKPAPFSKSANAQAFRQLIDRFDLGDRRRCSKPGPRPMSASPAGTSTRSPLMLTSSSTSSALTQPSWGAFAAACTSIWILAIPRFGRSSTASTCASGTRSLSHARHESRRSGLPVSHLRSSLEKDPVPDRAVRMGDRGSSGPAFTTVANWRDYSSVEWQGVWSQKAEAFKAVIDLPAESQCRSRCACRSTTGSRTAGAARQWVAACPRERVGDPDSSAGIYTDREANSLP